MQMPLTCALSKSFSFFSTYMLSGMFLCMCLTTWKHINHYTDGRMDRNGATQLAKYNTMQSNVQHHRPLFSVVHSVVGMTAERRPG